MSAPQPAADAPRGLLRVLGIAFGLAIIVGNTIGSGILRTPGDVAAALPSTPWFIAVWVAGGIYAFLGAMTLAELAVSIPKSGGEYVFARRAFGEYAGLVIGWTDWVSICAAGASIAIAFAELAAQRWASLGAAQTVIAIGITLGFVVMHWLGVRTGDRAQQALSLLKALAFVGVAAVCFLPTQAGGIAPPVPVAPPSMPAGMALATALVLSMQSVIYTYDGWNGAIYFGGEVRDPAREIPRSMGAGVVAVLAVYLALNAASLYALGIDGLAGSKFPAATAVGTVLGGSAEAIVSGVMALSLLGALSAMVMIGSRVPYALAVDGLMPQRAAQVNDGGTPTVALAATGACIALFAATGTFGTVIAIAAFFFVLKYCVSFSAVFALRLREPNLPRPYRALGYPVVTVLLLAGSVGFIVGTVVTDRRNSLIALGILVASYPAYRMLRARRG